MIRALFTVAFHTLFLLGADAAARTGSFSVQPYAANPIMGFTYNFYPEGIEYDSKRDRVLLGTLSSGGPGVQGKIFAVPYVNPEVYNDDDARVVYSQDDMTTVFSNSNGYDL
jgi:hypothetical protein